MNFDSIGLHLVSQSTCNPKYRWWVILGTALYFVSPIDIIPDFFPLSENDDAFLVTLLVSEVSQLLIEGVKAKSHGNTKSPMPVTIHYYGKHC